MSIKEVQQEVRKLPNLKKEVEQLKSSWIKPIRSNTNKDLPGLQRLPNDIKQEINQKLLEAHSYLLDLKEGQIIHEKLDHYARSLIQLKLNLLRGYYTDSEMITKRLLDDECLAIHDTIRHVKNFDTTVTELVSIYKNVSDSVANSLSLEESVQYNEMQHKKHIKNFQKIASKQKDLLKRIGRDFVVLARK
jgi:hypothetical protein